MTYNPDTAGQDLTPFFNKTDDDTADIVVNPDYNLISANDVSKLASLSGTNSGDQDLSTYMTLTTISNFNTYTSLADALLGSGDGNFFWLQTTLGLETVKILCNKA